MALGRAYSVAVRGLDGEIVEIEADITSGLPGVHLVGLPDAALQESRDRVRASFASRGLPWARRRITVNLAPSAIPKGGAGLDLPIALGVLVASGVVAPEAVAGYAFVGELGLDGSLRGVPGALSWFGDSMLASHFGTTRRLPSSGEVRAAL